MYPVIFSLGGFTLHTFGLFALVAFILGSFVAWKRGKEANLSQDDIFDLIILVSFAGLLGSRVLYILLNFEVFGFSLLKWFSVLNIAGMNFYGGLAAGVGVVWMIARYKGLDFFVVSDILVTGLSLAQSIGWLGALFAGFGYGREVERFGLRFAGLTQPRIPTQLLWSAGFGLLFYGLWQLETRYRMFDWYRGKKANAQPGFIFFVYFFALGFIQILLSFLSDREWRFVGSFGPGLLGMLISLSAVAGVYWRSGRQMQADAKLAWKQIIDPKQNIWKRFGKRLQESFSKIRRKGNFE